MNRRRLLGALAAGAATALSGCTGTTGSDTDTTTTDSDTTPESDPATVQVRSTDEYGDVLVDSDGMSLYLFTQDEGSESTCYDGCAEAWPPLTVDGEPTAADGVSVTLGTTERDGGAAQVTADGTPLYYYASDEQAGDTKGQGLNDAWYLLAPDGSRITGASTTTTTSDGGGGGGSGGTGY